VNQTIDVFGKSILISRSARRVASADFHQPECSFRAALRCSDLIFEKKSDIGRARVGRIAAASTPPSHDRGGKTRKPMRYQGPYIAALSAIDARSFKRPSGRHLMCAVIGSVSQSQSSQRLSKPD
jgi:hypothetical protein